MKEYNKKKADQLGMPIGTASGRLRKLIVFKLLKEAGKNFCFQCGTEIKTEKDLSIEHKIPWLDSNNPIELFFDLDNISFSHLSCNRDAARPKQISHPSFHSYSKHGCRCDECKRLNTERKRQQRSVK